MLEIQWYSAIFPPSHVTGHTARFSDMNATIRELVIIFAHKNALPSRLTHSIRGYSTFRLKFIVVKAMSRNGNLTDLIRRHLLIMWVLMSTPMCYIFRQFRNVQSQGSILEQLGGSQNGAGTQAHKRPIAVIENWGSEIRKNHRIYASLH